MTPSFEDDPQTRHAELSGLIRAELDESLAFIGDHAKMMSRGQRHPRLGPAVRDYIAGEIAWRVIAYLGESHGAADGPTPEEYARYASIAQWYDTHDSVTGELLDEPAHQEPPASR